jgi:hypothetical protein
MPIRWAYLKRVLAGAIFGLYMAHLLYFVNPQVEITPGRLASVTLVYGITCGFLFGSILWGFRALRVAVLGRPDPYRTHGFGFVVCAAFVSSFIYWMHLQLLRIDLYLPVGAVRILSKATNLITATAFVLLALWVIERNADRRMSRAIFFIGVLLIVLSAVFLYQRRDSYRTDRKEVVVTTIRAVAGDPVMLIAIRNLPYDWIVTMKGEGLLPWLGAATESAYFTRLEPFPTTSPKSLWASLATGKLPYRHGVTGRFSYKTLLHPEPFLLLPYGVGFRAWGLIPPVERISAPLPSGDALPVWSLFQRLQLPAQVVRWRSVQTQQERAEITAAPKRFDATGTAKPTILSALSADLGAAASIRSDVAFSALELDGFELTQRAVRVYANEIPPRGSVKGDAVRAYVQQLDRALAEIVRRHPRHRIVVCSPHAVTPPRLPANVFALVTDAITRTDPGADDGFLLVTGPDTAHRKNPPAARVVDVVPTLLFAGGLPIGRDMDGRIVTDAFTDDMLRRNALSVIQTYEAERVVVRRGGG